MSLASVETLRKAFPALDQDLIFMENAGGSPLPEVVIEAMTTYMRTHFVQHGAPYPLSQEATAIATEAHRFVLDFMGGSEFGAVVLGPSTSVLCQHLADAYRPKLAERNEIILAQTGHEANLGPWVKLKHHGAQIKWWTVDPDTFQCRIEELKTLITDKTLIVALPHVSNILGHVVDLGPIVDLAHEHGAKVVVDGVAFAPHRPMDVTSWGVDWYVYSTYKVFGPHGAALYGRFDAFKGLVGPNHYFIAPNDIPYKFELGGVNHEAMPGLVALQSYLQTVLGKSSNMCLRSDIVEAMNHIADLERPLQTQLIEGLQEIPGLHLIGPTSTGEDRVPTVSFIHRDFPSDQITAHLAQNKIAMRHGHMYAYRLLEALNLNPDPGVVRLSLAHFNTKEEVEKVLKHLSEFLN